MRGIRNSRYTRLCCVVASCMTALALVPGQALAKAAEAVEATEVMEATETAEATEVMETTEAVEEAAAPVKDVPVKDESVYVLADAAGTVQHVIVSDWLSNPQGIDVLGDQSFLTQIENLEGDETWEEKGDGTLEWKTGGQDIYYQGVTEEELPVTVSVTYTLDGEEMSPEEMAGKSGDFTIRYEYTNHLEKDVEIDGAVSTLHVPFAVITGTLLDEETLHNVQVTNGRVLSDGDLSIVAGIAFPGIAEDLKTPAYASLTKLVEADVPDYVEISGTTEDFRWNTTYTIVSNEILMASDQDASAAIDEIFGKLGSLKDGIVQIADGVTSLNSGAGELKEGTQSLSDGLATLTDNNEALQDGAAQIFDAALARVKEELEAAGLTLDELTMDNYATTLGLLVKFAQGENKEKLEAAIGQLDSLKEFYDGLVAYTDGVAQAGDGAAQINEGVAELQGGTTRLLLGTTILKAALPELSGVPQALKSSLSLGEDYSSFSGLADGMEGKVRFIWKLAEIG